jgi:Dna[CI] antecedent, DciA
MGRINDRIIKDVLNEYIHTNKRIATGYNVMRMDELWRDNMGSFIAGYTRKVSFYDGTLKIYLTSAPLKKELLMGKDKIIEIMNTASGDDIVKNVEIY